MSKSLFTPGPWSVDHYGAVDIIEAIDSNGFRVAECNYISPLVHYSEAGYAHWSDERGVSFIERSDAEQVANAHLIAAAPDLYEACEDVLRCAALPEHWTGKILAALAKARGEEVTT